MKYFWILLAVNLVALLLIGGGLYMAIKGIPNWGWLIAGGIISAQSLKSIKSDDEE